MSIEKVDLKIIIKKRLNLAKFMKSESIRIATESAQIKIEMLELIAEFSIDMDETK